MSPATQPPVQGLNTGVALGSLSDGWMTLGDPP